VEVDLGTDQVVIRECASEADQQVSLDIHGPPVVQGSRTISGA
jgi:hypothetical protein